MEVKSTEYHISIVAPLYNESEGFALLTNRIDTLTANLNIPIEVVLVDDGSKDNTALLMSKHALENPNYNCVFLSRNFGHQIAVTAGIAKARGTKALFIIDGDLQDPPELLPKFYELLQQGNDVVYAVRKKRKEGFIKRLAYSSFYRFLKQISTINIPLDSGDFAMISRRVANLMMKMPEESRFLRGMRTWVGFKQIGYEYERDERAMGSPKYTFKQLWQLAKNGIFNFSEAPIKLMKRAGYATIFFSFCYAIYILYQKFVVGAVPPGFTTLYLFLMVFAGLQFLFLGLIGEYILRIFFQVKQRPLFIVSNQIVDGQLQVLDYE